MALIKRIDHKCAHIVDQGISLNTEKGSVFAWAYLKKQGVSEAVIMRVLSTPSSRRPLRGQEHSEASYDRAADETGGARSDA